jgi:L-ascorbate metabolism protein UlaG (beta-lactamase superfamily)
MPLIDKIHWLGHASFLIKDGKNIYIDPWKITREEKADVVIITHEHYDHCSPDDLQKIVQSSTIIVTVPGNQSKISSIQGSVAEVKLIKPGDKIEVEGIPIEAVPAYNTDKNFHPKANEWIGVVITIGNERLYFAADTDLIEEMNMIKCDIALLPVSGTYVMTAEEAANAAKILQPKLAIPFHYGDIVGSEKDAKKFQSLCECDVKILEKE